MLPDYPNIKKRIDSLLLRHLKDEMQRRSPILGQITRAQQHEGHGGTQGDVAGKTSPIEYKKTEAEMVLTRDEMRSVSFDEVMSKVGEMAETLAGAQTRTLFSTVSEAAESAGNVVDGKGRLTQETFLDVVRKVQTDFDPRTGEPRHPTLVVHPDTWEKIKEDVETWDQDPDFNASLAEIEQAQRIAWRDREARRRLVD